MDRIKYLSDIGRTVFLLQSGENANQNFIEDIAYCCQKTLEINPKIVIILCLGNLSYEQYNLLKQSGAKRYILKFETSNPEHHKYCRPSDSFENRLNHINMLIELGFQTGSGNIIGLPNKHLIIYMMI